MRVPPRRSLSAEDCDGLLAYSSQSLTGDCDEAGKNCRQPFSLISKNGQNPTTINMPKLTKKSNFPTKLFVAASLATFILFGTLFFIIKINFTNNTANNQLAQQPNPTDKYYLNENYSEGDLLITKVP
ncbi:hypothetical protein KAU19_00815, partial [Candidatus Parcubacteria bacterium]|nr:hypothetical protein [Candidatus Parcubacteria bacterium]